MSTFSVLLISAMPVRVAYYGNCPHKCVVRHHTCGGVSHSTNSQAAVCASSTMHRNLTTRRHRPCSQIAAAAARTGLLTLPSGVQRFNKRVVSPLDDLEFRKRVDALLNNSKPDYQEPRNESCPVVHQLAGRFCRYIKPQPCLSPKNSGAVFQQSSS
jgi:hypothetical protein